MNDNPKEGESAPEYKQEYFVITGLLEHDLRAAVPRSLTL